MPDNTFAPKKWTTEPVFAAQSTRFPPESVMSGLLYDALRRVLRARRNVMQAATDGNPVLFDAAQKDVADSIRRAETVLAQVAGESEAAK